MSLKSVFRSSFTLVDLGVYLQPAKKVVAKYLMRFTYKHFMRAIDIEETKLLAQILGINFQYSKEFPCSVLHSVH